MLFTKPLNTNLCHQIFSSQLLFSQLFSSPHIHVHHRIMWTDCPVFSFVCQLEEASDLGHLPLQVFQELVLLLSDNAPVIYKNWLFRVLKTATLYGPIPTSVYPMVYLHPPLPEGRNSVLLLTINFYFHTCRDGFSNASTQYPFNFSFLTISMAIST